jgi:hypothetical protein
LHFAAEAVAGSVPDLDRVAVRIVVDSYQFAVAPSRKLPSLDVEHFGWGLSDKPQGSVSRLGHRRLRRRQILAVQPHRRKTAAEAPERLFVISRLKLVYDH